MFKTRNRTISWVPNSQRFIFNSALGINKVLASHELATQAAAGKKAKMFEEIVPKAFHSFRDVFDKAAMNGLPPKRHYDHRIRLKDEDKFEGRRAKIYPLSQDQERELDAFIDEHLAKGTIVPSEIPQALGFFFIKKKDGSLHPVQDYRFLNSHTVKNAYPLPRISDLFDQLKDTKIFTKMDIRWGYNNVRIHEADRWKAAFNTKRGLFEPTVMFFGLCNAPATFQATMNDIFADYIADGWLVIYMDDLLIFSADKTIHEERTKKVLQRLREQELSLKPEKCVFDTTEVEYLGMIIRPGEISMDKTKLDGIVNWPTLTTLKQVRSFLGFANFYRKFIARYSNVARPLIDLTKKDAPFIWSTECQNAFDSLKHSFVSTPVLQMPDKDKLFVVAVDASLYATGGVLMQKDSNSDLHPCSYLSQSLSPAERNYQIYDRELLAIIRALDAWHHYLQGSPFPIIVHTDHKNLLYWRDPRQLTARQSRWQLKLSEYDLQLQHIAGRDLVAPNALSRWVDHAPDDEPSKLQYIFPPSFFVDEELPPIHIIMPGLHDRLHLTSEVDSVVQTAVDTLTNSSLSLMQRALSDWKWEDGLLMFKGRYYIPPGPVRQELITLFHDAPTAGHPGRMKTQELISHEYWWPGLPTFVKKYVEGCAMCQQNKVNTHPTQPPLVLILAPSSRRPFAQCSVDLITDLPPSNGFDSIMVVVDHGLTKGVIFTPCNKSIDAEGVANIFFKKVFTRFGLYEKIISDRGPQFASKFAQELGRLLGYKVALSTAFHPQTDGETERVNQELEVYLRIYCGSAQHTWSDLLPMAEFVHNSRHHSACNAFPFYLMMGYHPLPLPEVTEKTSIPAVEDRVKTLQHAREEALASHELARQTMRQRITRNFVPFKKGDKVWLEGKNLHLGYLNRKLAPKREGPFTITEVLGPVTYRLKLPIGWKIHPVFHAGLLTPYRQNEEHGPNYIPEPPELVDSEEEYEVEAIIGHDQGLATRRKYRVRWKGCPPVDDEWMTESQLSNSSEILKAYKWANRLDSPRTRTITISPFTSYSTLYSIQCLPQQSVLVVDATHATRTLLLIHDTPLLTSSS